MRIFSEFRERLRALFSRDREDRELDEELAFHLEMQTRENIRRGMSPEEARRQAHLQLGGLTQVREATRDARGVRWLDDLAGDVRYAFRTLRKRPAFTFAAVATLALGIGGNTIVFGIVDALFLRPPAGVRDPGQVARVFIVRDEGRVRTRNGGPGSYLDFEAMRDHVPGFSAIAAMLSPANLDLDRGERAEQVRARAVSWNYLSLLGVRPALGRFFLAEEDSIQGAHPVAVLSHGFWKRRFGGESEIIGRSLLLNGQPVTVVGVAEAAFTGVGPEPVDLWVPLAMAAPLGMMFGGDEDWRNQSAMAVVNYVARLDPNVERTQVAAGAATALRHAAETQPGMDPTPDVLLASLIHARGPHRSGTTTVALMLTIVTAVVLVIACANVANLLLARGTARRRETAVRASLGAAGGRLIRQHLTESVVLALLGGVAGLAIAALGSGIARQFPLPPAASGIHPRVLFFALGISVLAGLVFGLAPALRSARTEPVEGLKGGEGGTRPGRGRLRRSLVALQVALSLVLLVGAGLLIQSLRAVYAIDPGLDVDRLLTVSVDLKKAGYDDPTREALYAAARDRVLRVPGVENAAMVHFTPLVGYSLSFPWDGTDADTALVGQGPYINWVGAGYFATAGTRLLRGREFNDLDRPGNEPVAVINEWMARVLAPGGDPLGRCIAIGAQVEDGGCTRIVGIVETGRHRYLDDATIPMIYLPRDRDPIATPSWGGPALLVRTHDDPVKVAGAVRAAVQTIAPDLPYVNVRPLEDVIRPAVLPYRLGATLFGLFGVLALLIAAVGLCGVLGYFVAERTAEIGIRRSLGAQERNVISLVVRQGMAPVAIGLGLGLAIAFAGGRLLDSLLFDVPPRDPLTFITVAVLLTAVALVASYLPARRAARVDPMIALRAE